MGEGKAARGSRVVGGDALRCRDGSCASASASRCSCRHDLVSQRDLFASVVARGARAGLCSTVTADAMPARNALCVVMEYISWDQSYRMVLSVRRRIHWGIGRFCFLALASFCFVRKDLWLCGRS